jgi:NAD-dependent SIR2 family protein deacetylase
MSEKRCSKCGERKSEDEFYAQPLSRDGRQSRCKLCTAQAVRERRVQLKQWGENR